MKPELDLLTVEDIADLLHIRPYTVREMARHRRIPATRVGKRWLFPRDAVTAWWQARTQGVAASQPAPPVVEMPRVVEPPKLGERLVPIFKRASWRQA